MPDYAVQPDEKYQQLRLKVSYWYVTNKLLLRQIFIIILIGVCIISYGYTLYRLGVIYLIEQPGYKSDLMSLTQQSIDYSYFREIYKPIDLEVDGFDSADGRDSRYDFIILVRNPNDDFVAREVELELLLGDEVIATKKSFIYPGEEKFIVFFGVELESGGSPLIRISKVGWMRDHDFAEFAGPRLKMGASNIDFKSSRESGVRGELPVSTLNFDLSNDSAYSFWEVGVDMILFSGSQVAGANYTSLEQFKSGETRNVEMRWYENLPNISRVLVQPEVDILDSDAYMPVE